MGKKSYSLLGALRLCLSKAAHPLSQLQRQALEGHTQVTRTNSGKGQGDTDRESRRGGREAGGCHFLIAPWLLKVYAKPN